jgi:hypothetical protein
MVKEGAALETIPAAVKATPEMIAATTATLTHHQGTPIPLQEKKVKHLMQPQHITNTSRGAQQTILAACLLAR